MSYLLRVLISIDQLGNTLAGGDPDATISARVGYHMLQPSPSRYWRTLERVIDFTFEPVDGPGHCDAAYMADTEDRHSSGSDAARLLLGVFVIAGCAVIAPIVRLLVLVRSAA